MKRIVERFSASTKWMFSSPGIAKHISYALVLEASCEQVGGIQVCCLAPCEFLRASL
jgi:hypothetical protein